MGAMPTAWRTAEGKYRSASAASGGAD